MDYHLDWHQEMTCSSEKINEIFTDLLNLFGIADDILITGNTVDGINHDRTLRQENLKLNKNMKFKMHEDTHLWESGIYRRHATRPKEAVCANKYALPPVLKRITIILGIMSYVDSSHIQLQKDVNHYRI